MIERLSMFPDDVLAFTFQGQVTKADYDSVFLPAVVDALKRHPKLRLYYEIAPDFKGCDVGAMWDDFAVGVEHITRWDRVAVVTDVEWVERATKLFGFIVPASVRLFSTSETAAGRAWISATSSALEHAR
jgi:hypothetical protein